MSFYATVRMNGRTVPAAGPFRRHGDALRAADAIVVMVHDVEMSSDRLSREAAWWSYGTAQVRAHFKLGQWNDRLGLVVDDDGFVEPASVPAAPQLMTRSVERTAAFVGRRHGDPLRYRRACERHVFGHAQL